MRADILLVFFFHRSPSLLSNLCQEFAASAAAGTAPPPTANYGGSGRGPADGHRLLDLTNRTGYPIVQRNGQRIYGPPPNWGAREQPSKGCEVFVGRVPRDIFEPELVPVFEKVKLFPSYYVLLFSTKLSFCRLVSSMSYAL